MKIEGFSELEWINRNIWDLRLVLKVIDQFKEIIQLKILYWNFKSENIFIELVENELIPYIGNFNEAIINTNGLENHIMLISSFRKIKSCIFYM